MLRMFDTEVQELKYKVLRELVRLTWQDRTDRALMEVPKTIVSKDKATMRCCVYKEQAIVQERVSQVICREEPSDGVVHVIDIACEECGAQKYTVSDSCRACIAHRCHMVCPVDAITFEQKKAWIDPAKCISCGKCAQACPYSAIAESVRPCVRGCGAGAIATDENQKARIDPDKCVDCGACVYECPFGAIVDKSWVTEAVQMIRDSGKGSRYKVYVAMAPAIVSQFSYAAIEQIVAGLRTLGVHSVVEVALGADIVAWKEAHELAEKGFLTSSCCPSFVKYIEINFPDMVQHISHNISPMAETARLIKQSDPGSRVIFIGPCVAKKAEAKKPEIAGLVDCVLTFEELQALLDGSDIRVETLEDDPLNNASYYGRVFARSGGLTEAVRHVAEKEQLALMPDSEQADGLDACRVALLKARKGKLGKNFIEGMACKGGCVNGAGCLHHTPASRNEVDKYARLAIEKDIRDSVRIVKWMD